MKTNSNTYMVAYVSVMAVAVAVILTGVGRFTGPRKSANEEAEKLRNVMQVFGMPVASGGAGEGREASFARDVRIERVGTQTRYLYVPAGGDRPQAVAIDFQGPGLWGPIKGLLALEPDMTTVRGLTFYQQEETPGLGGEIASEKFRSKFVGKKIRSASGQIGLVMRSPGTASAPHEFDAITGATMTCRKVESILNETLGSLKGEGHGP